MFSSARARIYHRVLYALYALSLAVSVSLWFVAIRAPLWLDETVSYFWINGGFPQLISRQGWPAVPAYSFVLWLWTKVVGTGATRSEYFPFSPC
jgi:hypothetical protein